MADRGIIFSAPMVRALLDGRKSQTRRLIKPQPLGVKSVREVAKNATNGRPVFNFYDLEGVPIYAMPSRHGFEGEYEAPYAPGDRLYVREAHTIRGVYSDAVEVGYKASANAGGTEFVEQWPVETAVNADGKRPRVTWPQFRPSIHMPRWASRLTLTVTDVRVQRLQEISEADAKAEGIYGHDTELGYLYSYARAGDRSGSKSTIARPAGWEKATHAYLNLWNTLHTKEGERWEDDPWIVAVSFTCEQRNIDA